jgi:arsenate reductase (thioredoxin)
MLDETPTSTPKILFLCVHNAGRSQMAAGWTTALAADRVQVFSGGSEPANSVNPVAVEAMAERGIDLSTAVPARWVDEQARDADVIVTMGCGDECPVYPGKRYLDWVVDDPSGRSLEDVRPIRDDIEQRVRDLLAALGVDTRP